VRAHEAYFGDEGAMHEASVQRALAAGEAEQLPAIFVVQPGEDRNVPLVMTLDLLRAYQAAGGHVEYAFYPGLPHAFATSDSVAAADCVEAVACFLRRRLAGAGEP
jgi:fermentation-respiration switch protein FrsA (DUF1100 family)